MSDDEVPKDDANVESGGSSDPNFPLFALRNKTKLGFIDGTCKRKSNKLVLANQWDLCNSVVVTWILTFLSPELYFGQIFSKTAYDMWTDLKETYDKDDGPIIFNLYKTINSLSQNGSSLSDYYHNLKSLGKQYDAMIHLLVCICDAAKHFDKHNQLLKLMQFLMGLDDVYQPIRSNILTRDPLPTVKTAFAVVSGEESHGNITLSGSHQSKPGATAFASKVLDKSFDDKKKGNNNYSGSNSNSAVNRRPNPNLKCTICNKIGHNDSKEGKIVRTGKQINDLYPFDVDHACKVTANNCITKCHMSKSLCHQRLGHPTKQILLVLKDKLNLDNETISPCDTCHKAKQTREPFPLSDHKTAKIGKLVHLDVWGPYKVSSREGFNPNDKGMVSFDNDGTELDLSDSKDIDSVATSMKEETYPEGTGSLTHNHDEMVKYGVERVVNYSNLTSESFCFVSALNKSIEPRTYKEAILDDNWVNVMNKEIEALKKSHMYKARLVAKGFNQREGIDYDETYSHVVKMVTVRCLISIVVQNKRPLYQLDVNNAFLYGDLKEDVYMTIPQGFGNTGNKNLVRKLKKSLYGLKQALRKWNENLVGMLRENGFVQSCGDNSLFTKTVNNIFVALLVYVDDIMITGNDEIEIKKFKQILSSKCQIKNLGLLKYFLGIEVIKKGDDIYLSQRKYFLELLNEFGLLACKPISIPIKANTVLPFNPSYDNPYLDNITGYQKLVGKLIYLTHTKPDISYYVHCLSQHMHSPLKSHLQSALNVLRYLKGSPGKGLKFIHNRLSNMLEGYADSDWAKCPKTRKSVSGYCVFYNENLIS
nr:ribonuclease H-like domain-containing protein [Tanacetum cinerariifolium]